jgi:perosamine synthetase
MPTYKELLPLSSPDITSLERNHVKEVLNTPLLSLGPKLTEFETITAEYLNSKYAIAVNSGTSALHLTLLAYDLKEGDAVITTPFSFISSASCLLFEKIKPIFIDIEPYSYNINTDQIEIYLKKRTDEELSRIKAILAVDIFGHPADWNALQKIAIKYNLVLIEDSSEALGSEYKVKNDDSIHGIWSKAGTLGNIGVISYYPNKQITTGEGGMLITNDDTLAEVCESMRNQGRDRGKENYEYPFSRLGYNYRLSDINCALGIAQMKRINEIVEKRRSVAEYYNTLLKNMTGVTIPFIHPDVKLSWFVYVIRLSQEYDRQQRNNIIDKMRMRGIGCGTYFQAIHLQPLYQTMFGFKRGDFPVTEYVAARTIALPFFNNIRKHEMEFVVDNLQKIISSINDV